MLVPDLAYINIGVRSEAEDVSSALAANNTQATAISDAIKAWELKIRFANRELQRLFHSQYDRWVNPATSAIQ
jgi:uncharacterized protein YggE